MHNEIVKRALTVANILEQQEPQEAESRSKVEELQKLKEDLKQIEVEKDELSSRNTAMRVKFVELDENVKEDADKIQCEMKALFKKLGLKVTTETSPDNFVDLQIQFAENDGYRATFVYDPITEDYDRKFILRHSLGLHINCSHFSDGTASRSSPIS